MPSWTDVEVASLNDPYLHAAVHHVRNGLSREDALIAASIALAESLSIYKQKLTDVLAHCMCGASSSVVK